MTEKIKEIVETASKIFEDGKISIDDIPTAISLLFKLVSIFKNEN